MGVALEITCELCPISAKERSTIQTRTIGDARWRWPRNRLSTEVWTPRREPWDWRIKVRRASRRRVLRTVFGWSSETAGRSGSGPATVSRLC